MNGLAKIPATIITGFLGAGKTTLIRHLLANSGGRRLALVINEFGDVGVDAEILKGCGDLACDARAIVELANGCICCTVADDFLPAIEQLLALDPPPEHIVIETSGLALPKPLVKAFDWPAIRSKLTVDGVIAIVDGAAVAAGRFADDPERLALQRKDDPSVDHDDPLEEVFGDQLVCADLIVMNKSDLISAAQRQAVIGAILARAPRAKIISAAEGKIEPAILLGLGAAAEDDVENRPSCHDGEAEHDHDDFDSMVVEVAPVEDSAAFMQLLAAVAGRGDILRIKGFLDVRGKPMRLLVQGVGERLQHNYDRPWRAEEPRRGRLVIIGAKGFDGAAVTGLLNVSEASI